ncbi:MULTISPECIES: DUF4190 domain-containing protein [unclassified Nocardia]|uniref:DUF4190 domain-containing protein n=1 Tax=unclassified Nocardia TaxID=2637762 RepID=UPI001CE3DFA9|nr:MULTISPECIES: DUF4190 domain-containing protein [unclassified Nocardia]
MSQYPPPDQYPQDPGQHQPPPGQYPPTQYPGPGQGPYWQESPKSKGLAIAALVLGIIALVTCFGAYLFGLLAVIFGVIALARKNGGGKGMAIAGIILGVIGLIIAIGATIFAVNTGVKDLYDCVNKANGDQAKIDKCNQDWKGTLENKFSVTLTPQPTP